MNVKRKPRPVEPRIEPNPKPLSTAEIRESFEYGDVVLRISTSRGSFPICIVENGEVQDHEKIGRKIVEGFKYYIESEVFDNAN